MLIRNDWKISWNCYVSDIGPEWEIPDWEFWIFKTLIYRNFHKIIVFQISIRNENSDETQNRILRSIPVLEAEIAASQISIFFGEILNLELLWEMLEWKIPEYLNHI